MQRKVLDTIIFALSGICLIITIHMFISLGIFVDEFNTSPSVVLGGDFWLYMNWLKLAVTMIIFVLFGINLFSKK